MIDIAYGFIGCTFKKSRTTLKIYALVCVCIVLGATNILALDSITMMDVLQALERHAYHHGVPANIYTDSGSQLIKLKDATFSMRSQL